MARRLVPLGLVLLLTALSGTARGEREGAALEAAGELFRRGVAAFDEGRYDEALEAFRGAHELAPNGAVLFNIGRTLSQLGRNVEAADALERALGGEGSQLPEEIVAVARLELERLSGLLGRLVLHSGDGERVELLLDGEVVGATPPVVRRFVTPGRHVIDGRRPGATSLRREVSVDAGGEVELELTLDPAEPGALPDEPGEASDAGDQAPAMELVEPAVRVSSRRARSIRSAAYALIGLGVASLGTGAVLLVWNDGRHEDWVERDGALQSWYLAPEALERPAPEDLRRSQADNDELADSIPVVDVIGWVLGAVGLAVAVAGVVMALVGPAPRPRRQSHPSRSPSTSRAGGAQ